MSQQHPFLHIRCKAPVIPTAECTKTGILSKGNEDEHFNALCRQATRRFTCRFSPTLTAVKEVTPPFSPSPHRGGETQAARNTLRLRSGCSRPPLARPPPAPIRSEAVPHIRATTPTARARRRYSARSYAPIHPRHHAHSAAVTALQV